MTLGCGVEEKCPQGAYETEGQCLLIEQDGVQVEIPEEEALPEEMTVDAVISPDGTLDENDAVDSTALDSSLDTTGWDQKLWMPTWRQRMQPQSTEAPSRYKAMLRGDAPRVSGPVTCERPDNETVFTAPDSRVARQELVAGIMMMVTQAVAESALQNRQIDSDVGADLSVVTFGTDYGKEDVNQRRCRRESRRDRGGWPLGQPRVGNPLQGAV